MYNCFKVMKYNRLWFITATESQAEEIIARFYGSGPVISLMDRGIKIVPAYVADGGF